MNLTANDGVANNIERWWVYVILCVINFLALSVYGRTPQIGSDYRAFYVAGQTARANKTQIYDLGHQISEQMSQFGSVAPFFHAPHELLLFAPLSLLPYKWSFLAWLGLSALFLASTGLVLAAACELPRSTAVLITAAIFPVTICFELGQDSLLLLFLVATSYLLSKNGHGFSAGGVLALALFKPQLPLILFLALLVTRRFRLVSGFICVASVIVAGGVAFVGSRGIAALIRNASITERVLPIVQMPNIRGLLALLIGDHPKLSMTISALVVLLFMLIWRRFTNLEFVFATAICIYGVAAQHLFAYDLVVLAVPVMLYSGLPKLRYDPLLLICMFGAPLFLIARAYRVPALMIIPTISMCLASFRLRDHSSGLVPEEPCMSGD